MKKPILLAILDGYGHNNKKAGNAIALAQTPNLDTILNNNPHTLINASGLNVGLPEGQMGNSEVGHTNIGAGRIVYQGLTKISKSISDGDFFCNIEFLNAIKNCKKYNSNLHIMGLSSNGGVHSHLSHLYALLKLAKTENVNNVYIHCFTDGRDVDIKSANNIIYEIEDRINEIGIGKISTIMGRYYAMDRDNRWERIKKAYDAMVNLNGTFTTDIHNAILNSYNNNITDEFIEPIICDKNGQVKKNDSIIFFNFRPDRAREITRTFIDENFTNFKRDKGFLNNYFVCMTQYDENFKNVHIAFKAEPLKNTLGEYISNIGLSQLRIAETEKYAHVTFFFNGGIEKKYKNEDRILISSPNVSTYDKKPEMSANIITEKVIEAINSEKYDIIILNYANCDMVGHTGDLNATIKAVETVDKNVGKIVTAINNKQGITIITADHGNAELMLKEDGNPMTAHTTNLVDFTIVGHQCNLNSNGKLADIAPTILDLMEIKQPPEMDGKSLIINKL